MGVGDARIAGNHLAAALHDADRQAIVDQPKGIGDALEEYLTFHVLLDLSDEEFDRPFIFRRIGGDRVVLVEHFRALFGNFVAVTVGAQGGDERGYRLDIVDVPAGDHRSQFHMQVRIVLLECFQLGEEPHHLLEIALYPTDGIVLFVDVVKAGFDRQPDVGTVFFQVVDDLANPPHRQFRRNSVGGDVDDARGEMSAGQVDNVGNIGAQKRLAAADVENIDMAHGAEYFFDFPDGQFVFQPLRPLAVQLPDTACLAPGLAQIGDREGEIERRTWS